MGISKEGKTYASRYNTDVSVTQTSNTGFDSTTRKLCSGDGADSSMAASDDVFQVKPVNDDTTSTMNVQTSGGSTILAVDTTNSLVKVNISQVNATTMYKEFGCYDTSLNQTYHVALPCHNMISSGGNDHTISTDLGGNGVDPDTSYRPNIDGDAEKLIMCYWYIMDNITIDAVSVLGQYDDATPRTVNYHLMKYDYDNSDGDLSNGLVIADGTDELSLHRVQQLTLSKTGANVDVDTDQVVMGFVEAEDATDRATILMTVKYHIR